MSWDVILIKERFDWDADNSGYKPPLLGNRDEIITSLKSIFPNIDYTDKSWGLLSETEYSIEFNTGSGENVDSIMLHIRGGGNPVNAIKLIMKEMGWEALDCSTSEFIDLEKDNPESWTEFQKFRDNVLKKNNK